MKTMLLLKESLDRLSPTERRVAEHILSLGDKLLKTSIGEIASSCGTGKSVVVQACKKAGYKGFKDLCNAYSATSASSHFEATHTYIDIFPGVPEEDICRIVTHNVIQAVEGTLELINVAELRRAADAVLNARRILLLGAGGSGTVAQDTYHKMQRIGLDAQFTPDVHCQQLATITLSEKDCVIAFSYSGQTVNILEAAELAREQGATIIAVTHIGDNALGNMADIRINVAGGESMMRTGALTSRQSMLTAMDMLTTCVASRNYDKTIQYLESATEISRRLRTNKH